MRARTVITALCALALGVAVFLHTLLYSDSWQQRQRARQDLAAIQANNDAAKARLDAMRGQIEALRKRPEVQERVIRQELGFTRPGEIVLELGAVR
jgi:cell division protein FtsB